ncbi:MAG: hypothetical protein ACXVCY_16550 [Pseudobdellovibrionaceae bacterium]
MRKIIALFLLSLVNLFSLGCATQRSMAAQRIVETDESTVKSCLLLGETKGSSSIGGLAMQETGKANAKNEAIDNAVNMGATHIVWKVAEGGFFGGHAHALAYNCRKKK